MNDTSIGLDQTEEEMLTYEVSDETLEASAGMDKTSGNFTNFCTGISCPG